MSNEQSGMAMLDAPLRLAVRPVRPFPDSPVSVLYIGRPFF
jgi:hypothetical protein